MRNHTLADWLQHWLAQHPREIVMGLDRVRAVWSALAAPRIARIVIAVAGTNGKGSSVAFLDSMLRAGGYRVGRYTSPHLHRFNERIVIDGVEVGDDVLIAAFARIDTARAGIPITYFEAATLAALLIFADAGLDAAVLEVGLGGRLDAVNLIDADVALITSIGLDHQEILGNTLAAIAVEKAGICRVGRPVVVAMTEPPTGLIDAIARIGARPLCAQGDYSWQHRPAAQQWTLCFGDRAIALPLPRLSAPVQLGNAAGAVMALLQCADQLPLAVSALCSGIANANVPGRLQVVAEQPEVVLDVAHNPQAAQALAAWLVANPRRTRAVFSVLTDKDAAGIVAALQPHLLHWYVSGLIEQTPRGAHAEDLLQRLCSAAPRLSATAHATPKAALAAALAASSPDERVLVFGSFYLIAELLPA